MNISCWPTIGLMWTGRMRWATSFRDEKRWTRMSILNAARMGKFSSDRAIREYCEKVWGVKPF